MQHGSTFLLMASVLAAVSSVAPWPDGTQQSIETEGVERDKGGPALQRPGQLRRGPHAERDPMLATASGPSSDPLNGHRALGQEAFK